MPAGEARESTTQPLSSMVPHHAYFSGFLVSRGSTQRMHVQVLSGVCTGPRPMHLCGTSLLHDLRPAWLQYKRTAPSPPSLISPFAALPVLRVRQDKRCLVLSDLVTPSTPSAHYRTNKRLKRQEKRSFTHKPQAPTLFFCPYSESEQTIYSSSRVYRTLTTIHS